MRPTANAILFRVQTARKPETRARRIATLVEMLERNEKIHA
ncbi:MAG: YdeI/OmpD-associated family protein [Gemmatimonadetes bacterium]|nr:YdeI/OmpD-associated family protein [Gemmatimonadota bacterium]